MEAFRQFTPYDPSKEQDKAMLAMAFVEQASKDIRRKLQKMERLQDKTIRKIIQVAEKFFNNRETKGEKEERNDKEREEREIERDKQQN